MKFDNYHISIENIFSRCQNLRKRHPKFHKMSKQTISQKGIDLIKKWEGCKLTAYQCPAKVWTIGFGHTKGVDSKTTCTQAQADQWLREEIVSHVSGIYNYVTVPLTQNQFDALASFHYNLGANILKGSTLLNLINANKWDEAAKKMKEYCKAGGKVCQGLVNRRNDEAAIFLTEASGGKTYKVIKGDCLSVIGKKVGVSWELIAKLNGISHPYTIYPDQVLKLQ